jgi:hypothetical protein
MYIRVLRISKTNFFTNSIKISQLGHIQIILTKIEQLFYYLLLNLKKKLLSIVLLSFFLHR